MDEILEAQNLRTIYLRVPRRANKLRRRLRLFLQRLVNDQAWVATILPLTMDLPSSICKEFVDATASVCMRILYRRSRGNRKRVYRVRKEDILHTLRNSLPTKWFPRETKILRQFLEWVAAEATTAMNSRLHFCYSRWRFRAPDLILNHAVRMWNNVISAGTYAGDGYYIIPITNLGIGDAERY